MIRKDLVIAATVTFILTVSLFAIIPASSSGRWPYNPWWDLNDDGRIDINELAMASGAYATYGSPVNKTALLLDVNSTFTKLLLKISALNASLVALQSQMNVLNSTLTSKINNLETKIALTNATVASLLGRMDALEKNCSGNAILFNTTYSTSVSATTEIYSWIDMSGMSVTITQNRTSDLLIMFSADAYNNNQNTQDYILSRALVDAEAALPNSIILTPWISEAMGTPYQHHHYLNYAAYSYNFIKLSVPAGKHTVKMQWQVTGHTGYVYYRTLSVIALP